MTTILGINPQDWTEAGGESIKTELSKAVDALVAVALEQRQAARTRKDYAAADAIRDQLSAAGISVEDTADGPRWTLA